MVPEVAGAGGYRALTATLTPGSSGLTVTVGGGGPGGVSTRGDINLGTHRAKDSPAMEATHHLTAHQPLVEVLTVY